MAAISKLPIKVKAVIVLAVVAVAFFMAAFGIPAMKPDPKTEIVTVSNLEKAVEVGELSTIDYVYKGVAEKPGLFGSVEYRIRYEAHVSVSFDMGAIEFSVDESSGVVTAVLPEPKVGEPVIDDEKLDYLPDGAHGDFGEVMSLCKEDASAEIADDFQIVEWSISNLEDTVRSLIVPLVGDEAEVVFERYGEPEGGVNEEA